MTPKLQTRYLGRLGGGYVRQAFVRDSMAGILQVWIGDFVAMLDDQNHLVLSNEFGMVARLRLSDTAIQQMKQLEKRKRELQYPTSESCVEGPT